MVPTHKHFLTVPTLRVNAVSYDKTVISLSLIRSLVHLVKSQELHNIIKSFWRESLCQKIKN